MGYLSRYEKVGRARSSGSFGSTWRTLNTASLNTDPGPRKSEWGLRLSLSHDGAAGVPWAGLRVPQTANTSACDHFGVGVREPPVAASPRVTGNWAPSRMAEALAPPERGSRHVRRPWREAAWTDLGGEEFRGF